MLKIKTHTSTKDAVDYHTGANSESALISYYTSWKGFLPRFWGAGAERLGITELPITKKSLTRLLEKRNPLTNEKLFIREKQHQVVARDAVLSPPKSVSVVLGITDDVRILKAHRSANGFAMRAIQQSAMTRVRKGGECSDRIVGELTIASFLHMTSREEDPQIHSHNLIANCVYDPVEKEYKALQTSEIYKKQRLFTEIYRSALVGELHQLGYRTRITKNGFEIEGVSPEIIAIFSKRNKAINKQAKELKQGNNPKSRELIAMSSRSAKKFTPIETLRKRWIAELTDEQYQSLLDIKASATRPCPLGKTDPVEAIEWAKTHLTERLSVVSRNSIIESSLKYSRGSFTEPDLQSHLDEAVAKGVFIALGDDFTTPEVIETEQKLIALVDDGCSKFPPFNEDYFISGKLTAEQRGVVAQTLLSQDRFTAIRGVAGAGKTTALTELVKGITETYGQPVVLAPSGSATELLREDNFENAITLQRFLTSTQAQRDAHGKIIVVDEAGMVSLNQMLQLAELATKHNYRVILVGDSKQHSSVERPCLDLLESESKLRTATLTTIFRQKDAPQYLKAVEELADGDAVKAFDMLNKLGWVKEIAGETSEGRGKELAEEFVQAINEGETSLVVTSTWREADATTAEIRPVLRNHKLIGKKDRSFNVLIPLHQTLAEREEAWMADVGSTLVFTRKSKSFVRGEQVSVEAEINGLLRVKRKNGESVDIDPKAHANDFQAYLPQTATIAVGDKILLRANARTADDRKLLNGQIVGVKKIVGDKITLTDGRVLPANYRTFTLGYCITSQSSQAKTVDNIFISIDAQSAHSATSLEGFYVAVSRGRKTCKIFTDSKAVLRKAVEHSSSRKSATSLLAKIEEDKKNYENNPQLRPTGKPVSEAVKLAIAKGLHHPRHNPSTRNRADHIKLVESKNQSLGEEQSGLHPGTTRDIDLRGRGSADGKIPRSPKPHDAPQLV